MKEFLEDRDFITLKEAAKMTGYSPDYIGQLIRAKELGGKKIYLNHAWVVDKRDLLYYLKLTADKKRGRKARIYPTGGGIIYSLKRTIWKLFKILVYTIVIILITLFVTLIFTKKAKAVTGVPKIISHQGRLFDSSGSLLGGSGGTNFCFRFSLYDDATVGAPDTKFWPAGTPSTMTVNVKSGVYNVGIGDTAAGGDSLTYNFEDNDSTFLNIEVANSIGGSCAGVSVFETLSPRPPVHSSGFAINALTLRGFSPSAAPASSSIPVLTTGGTLNIPSGLTAFNGLNYTWPSSGAIVGRVLTVTSTTGVLSWEATGGSGITSLNGLSAYLQTFQVGAVGSDFNISSSISDHTFNLPNAGVAARGLVSTTTQSFAGAKTFSDNVIVGDASADKLTINSELASSIIPDTDNLYNLGTSTRRFANFFANNATINNLTVSSGLSLPGGDLDMNNNLILNIGAAGTDFTGGGGLNLAGALTVTGASTLANPLIIGGLTYNFPGIGPTNGQVLTVASVAGGFNTLTWQTPLAGITSLNGLTTASQTFQTGTTGLDFNIASTGSAHTFNLPDASGTARGLVSTTTQSFAGNKTFDNNLLVNGDTTIGNASADSLTVTARLASHLLPSVSNTFDLGAPGLAFRNIYASSSVNVGSTVFIRSHEIEFSSSSPNLIFASGAGRLNFQDSAGNALAQIIDNGTTGNLKLSGQIQIQGGSPAAGKVLQSNASGLATWVATSSLGITAAPAGANGAVQFNNLGAFGGDAANFFWDKTNNRLGIGTASPARRLDVVENTLGVRNQIGITNIDMGSGSGMGLHFFGTAANNLRFFIEHRNDLNFARVGTTANAGLTSSFRIVTNDTDRIYIDGGVVGRIGIGENFTSPSAQLHVRSQTATETALKLQGAASQTANLQEWQNSVGAALAVVNASGNFGIAAEIEFSSSSPHIIFANGTGNLLNFQDSAGNNLAQIIDNGTTGNLKLSGQIQIQGGSPAAGKVLQSDANGLATWVATSSLGIAGDGGGWTDDGTIVRLSTASDKVGIGTSTPQTTLHVEGVTTVDGHILPEQHGLYDVGSSAVRFRDAYFSGIVFSGGSILSGSDGAGDFLKFTKNALRISKIPSIKDRNNETKLMEITADGLIDFPSGNIKLGNVSYTYPKTGPSADGQYLAASSTAGFLEWRTLPVGGSGITTLNGLTTSSQTFQVSTAGSNFNIVSLGSTHTFNIPDASATARGLVSTTTQTLAGNKTFTGNVIIGDAAADKLTVNAELASSIVPDTNNLYDLGAVGKRFKTGRFNTVDVGGGLTITPAEIKFSSSADISFQVLTFKNTNSRALLAQINQTSRGGWLRVFGPDFQIGGLNYRWPSVVGGGGRLLQSDSSGQLIWAATSSLGLVTGPAGASGAAQFNNAGVFGGDAPNFFWDNTNKRLGIGTNTPTDKLTVSGDINVSDPAQGYEIGGTRVVYTPFTDTLIGIRAGSILPGTLIAASDAHRHQTAVGYEALKLTNRLSVDNTAIGYQSMYNNEVGSDNVAVGAISLFGNISGLDNVAIGKFALLHNQTGNFNTAVGKSALSQNMGSKNIALGYQAGDNIILGSKNLIIGYDIDAPSGTVSNQLNIGNIIFGTGIDGIGTIVSTGNIGIGTVTPNSFKLEVAGSVGPSADNLYDLGSSTKRWRDVFVGPGSLRIGQTGGDEVVISGDGRIRLFRDGKEVASTSIDGGLGQGGGILDGLLRARGGGQIEAAAFETFDEFAASKIPAPLSRSEYLAKNPLPQTFVSSASWMQREAVKRRLAGQSFKVSDLKQAFELFIGTDRIKREDRAYQTYLAALLKPPQEELQAQYEIYQQQRALLGEEDFIETAGIIEPTIESLALGSADRPIAAGYFDILKANRINIGHTLSLAAVEAPEGGLLNQIIASAVNGLEIVVRGKSFVLVNADGERLEFEDLAKVKAIDGLVTKVSNLETKLAALETKIVRGEIAGGTCQISRSNIPARVNFEGDWSGAKEFAAGQGPIVTVVPTGRSYTLSTTLTLKDLPKNRKVSLAGLILDITAEKGNTAKLISAIIKDERGKVLVTNLTPHAPVITTLNLGSSTNLEKPVAVDVKSQFTAELVFFNPGNISSGAVTIKKIGLKGYYTNNADDFAKCLDFAEGLDNVEAVERELALAPPAEEPLLISGTAASGSATSEGPRNGGIFASDNSFGTVMWSSTTNAQSSDDLYAAANLNTPGSSSNYLKVLDFGFNIPTAAVITGIVFEIEKNESSAASDITDARVRVVKNGVVGATDKADATEWPTTDAYSRYPASGNNDLWGESWTATDINGPNFGVVIAANAAGTGLANIDHVRVTVYYSQ